VGSEASPVTIEKFVKELKKWGVMGFTSTHSQNSNRWSYTGEIMVDGVLTKIKVDGGEKPPSCRIEESTEYREVKVYKAICEETGEAVTA